MEKEILFLSMEDVLFAGGADMDLAIEDMRKAFGLFHRQRIVNPMKVTLRHKDKVHEHHVGLVNCLPAYVCGDKEDFFSFKILGAMPPNTSLGMPRATGVIVLFESQTKSPIAILDAQVISAVRTGAVSALAAEKFVFSDVEEVGLVGAGVNMRTQLLGVSKTCKSLKRVKVYSRGKTKDEFAKDMSRLTGLEIEPVCGCEEAISGQRFYITCLPNLERPVVRKNWVGKKGMTIFNIGCYENETSILADMDRVVADWWEQGKHRGVQSHAIAVREGVIPESKIEDFTPIVVGNVPGRTYRDENIFFNPTGLGFEDAVIAWRVYHTAKARKIGTDLSLWRNSKWI